MDGTSSNSNFPQMPELPPIPQSSGQSLKSSSNEEAKSGINPTSPETVLPHIHDKHNAEARGKPLTRQNLTFAKGVEGLAGRALLDIKGILDEQKVTTNENSKTELPKDQQETTTAPTQQSWIKKPSSPVQKERGFLSNSPYAKDVVIKTFHD